MKSYIKHEGANTTYYYNFHNNKITTKKPDNATVQRKNLDVTLLTTTRCNFRCIYCYQEKYLDEMSTENFNKIIKYFYKNIGDYDGLRFELFGGEPLLHVEKVKSLTENITTACKSNSVPFWARLQLMVII